MAEDSPFKTEYAKSGRSSCRGCKLSISKDSLRLAKMVQVWEFQNEHILYLHQNMLCRIILVSELNAFIYKKFLLVLGENKEE